MGERGRGLVFILGFFTVDGSSVIVYIDSVMHVSISDISILLSPSKTPNRSHLVLSLHCHLGVCLEPSFSKTSHRRMYICTWMHTHQLGKQALASDQGG